MKVDNGWLYASSEEEEARIKHTPSSFCNLRPDNEKINTLVIHNISLPPNQFKGDAVENLFLGCLNSDAHPSLQALKDVEVSSHLFIRRKGLIQQFVSFDERAWHAGVSQWKGRENCNDFSIGIEMEGADCVPYTSMQYQSLVEVTKILMQAYSIGLDDITGHEHIAPGRKTDPGEAFHWSFYKQYLR